MKIDRRGAIPIPYIIALLFGVAIIVVVGYLLITSEVDFMRQIALKKCEAKKMDFCNKYRTGEIGGSDIFKSYADECAEFANDNNKWGQSASVLCTASTTTTTTAT